MASTCPSGRYLDAVRTIGGLTPEAPFKHFGPITVETEWDYAEWYALIQRLRASMEAAYHALFKEAMAKDPAGGNARIKTSGDRVQAKRDRITAMVEPWDWTELHDLNAAVDAAVTLAVDIACEWQTLDDELDDLGIDVPEPRPIIGEDPDRLGIIGTIALGLGAVVLVGGTFWIARKVMK